MIPNKYEVVLTNGTVNHTYNIVAFCEREATILAQAEAINNARGYDVISVKKNERPMVIIQNNIQNIL